MTGSGKTLSFLIPLVERLLKAEEPNKKYHVRSIVLAPTKELATQIYDVLQSLLGFHAPSAGYLQHFNKRQSRDEDDNSEDDTGPPAGPYIIPQLAIGGRVKLQEDLATFAALNPNVLIGTPKRLLEMLDSSRVVIKRHFFDLLVLDEADRLLDANFQTDLQRILSLLPKERRTALFSASVSAAVDELVRVGLRYPFKISAKVRSKTGALDKKTPESLRLYHILAKPGEKLPLLKHVLEQSSAQKTIVYVSTRAAVDHWARVLPIVLDLPVLPLHGAYKADFRAKNLQRFRDHASRSILLTTDVLARGIDIPEIDLVVQLDPPSQPKDFIHRCGRTGRAGKRGAAITFLTPGAEEDYIRYLALQSVVLEPYPQLVSVSEVEVSAVSSVIREQSMQKRETYDRTQRAFVSWVQAYIKTQPAEIFQISKIDWPAVGQAWGLLHWPKMPEIKRYLPAATADHSVGLSVPEGFSLANLQYADDAKEQKRQTEIVTRANGEHVSRVGKVGQRADLARKKERAWSSQKDAKAVRDSRRERKEVKRKAEKGAKMNDSEKVQEAELQQLLAQVRAQNAQISQDDFGGFGE